MIKRLLSILLVLSFVIISCKKDTRDLKEVQDLEIKDFLGSNLTSFTKDSNGIYHQILIQPTGDSITNIEQIFYLQTVKTKDGTTLLNSDKYNYFKNYLTDIKPIGFNKSIFALIKTGGKIRSIIPSYLAFGKDGSGSVVKGNAIIDATFEVINANSPIAVEDTLITRYQKNLGLTFTRDASGVYYSIIESGNGIEEVTLSSKISANYTGKFFNGVQFDASTSGTPFTTVLGTGVIKGWQILTKLKKGGKIRLLIPSHKAYGTTGNGTIPSNTPLDFEIELVNVE